jgi:uncharacterized protein with PQ loop repeat
MNLTTMIGLAAAFLHDRVLIPAAQEVLGHRLRRRPLPQDVFTLAAGVALWAVYGFLHSDLVIILANTISFILLMEGNRMLAPALIAMFVFFSNGLGLAGSILVSVLLSLVLLCACSHG